jgi:DNA-binding transcriptional LysR family regulator
VRHGGFSAASRATGEPKSKLSKRVAQLEQDQAPAMKFAGACG